MQGLDRDLIGVREDTGPQFELGQRRSGPGALARIKVGSKPGPESRLGLGWDLCNGA